MTVDYEGTEATFSLVNVDVETTFALDAGTTVSIVYQGDVFGVGEAGGSIIMIVDPQESMEVLTVEGSVENQAMSTFTIKTSEGESIGFMKNNCEGLRSGVLGQEMDNSDGNAPVVKVTYITVSFGEDNDVNFPLKVEVVE